MSTLLCQSPSVSSRRRLLMVKRDMQQLTEGSNFKSTKPYCRILTLILESALPFTFIDIVTTISAGARKPREYNVAVCGFPIVMVSWLNALVRQFQNFLTQKHPLMHLLFLQALSPQLSAFRIISGMTWTSNPTAQGSRPLDVCT